jgi:hypothetical protein
MLSRPIALGTTLVLLVLSPAAGAFAQKDGSWRTDFSRHTVPLEEILSGGPPKDGIPAIDRPIFVTVSQASRWLEDNEPVAVVEIGGEVKAYPLQILIWHEIVNDFVGGVPVSITFCPLCNTTLAFDRRFDGRVLDFGTTGNLRHSDMVMYDRQTETWWQQATGEGIVGEYAGRRPPWAFLRRKPDNRLAAMERVVALELGDQTRAYPFETLREKRVVHDQVGDREIVVLWTPGTASAVDSERIADGRDVGSSGVFDRHVAAQTLTFDPAEAGQFRDRETGSIWTILGRAVAGPLTGQRLSPIQHGNHFWFAWAVFKPDTEVVK